MRWGLIAGGILMVLILLFGVSSCSSVEPGHVGVKVSRYGGNAGVSDKSLGVGNYFLMPGESIYEYPIFTNNYEWKNGNECDKEGENCTGSNEEFRFQDKNGLVVTADIALAYRVDPVRAPILYQKYRVDMQGLVAGPIRNAVRDAIVAAANKRTVEQIYGSEKTAIINEALATVRKYFEPFGLHVEQLYWTGPVRIPSGIMERINNRAQEEQAAIAARARAEREKADGEASIARANAEAAVKVANANAEAAATKAKNEAVANTPGYQDEWIRKWDGKLPQTIYCSADKPCLEVGR